MKFKVKALRQRDEASEAEEEDAGVAEEATQESVAAARELVEAANGLVSQKSAILSRMVNRRAEEKKRLAEIDASDVEQDIVVAEATSLAEDFEDVSTLHSELSSISKLVLAASQWIPLSDEVKAKAAAMEAGASGRAVAGSDDVAKEEQLAKREELVDRKIKGYAAKKKELMEREEALAKQLEELEAEKASLERLRQEASDTAAKDWEEREREIVRRITILQTVMAGVVGKTDSKENGSMDDGLSDLEASIKMLLDKSSTLEGQLTQMKDCEAEMKELLSVLDKLLGRLPEDAVQEFTGSDAYKLYEKVLDRYGI